MGQSVALTLQSLLDVFVSQAHCRCIWSFYRHNKNRYMKNGNGGPGLGNGTSHPKGQQSLTWGTFSSRYKYNWKLHMTFDGTVETTGTETKKRFLHNKNTLSYEEMFWHPRALNCKASSQIQLKFELHWDFMPVLVASKFEEDMIENKHHFFFSPLKGT